MGTWEIYATITNQSGQRKKLNGVSKFVFDREVKKLIRTGGHGFIEAMMEYRA